MRHKLMKSLISIILFTLILTIASNSVLAQTDEKTFTNTKFGLSLKYPSDWTFVPEEQEFTPGIYDYTVMIPPGSASLGEFCPNSNVGSNPIVADCGTESPAGLSISVYKLKDGTTLEEFYEKELTKFNTEVKSLVGGREFIETNKVNISGLSAIQTISVTTGGGSLGLAGDDKYAVSY